MGIAGLKAITDFSAYTQVIQISESHSRERKDERDHPKPLFCA